MTMPSVERRSATRATPWWLLVFGLALLLRLGFLFLVDEPLLYTHQYHYFKGSLSIAEHGLPLAYVLRSEEWRTWGSHWTMAPLYYLFAAGVFEIAGPHILPLQLLQCLLDACTAVMVAMLGRAVAGRVGTGAGIAYALYWPAVELPSRTMTENLHTPLLVGALTVLALGSVSVQGGRGFPTDRAGSSAPGLARAAGAGILLGLSALTRAVGLAFLPLAVLWQLGVYGIRRGWPASAVLVVACLTPIAPWAARNFWILGDPSPIESVSIYNLWTDNAFVDQEHYWVQEFVIQKQKTPAERRAKAIGFALRGLRERPQAVLGKVRSNLRHFLRPEGLHVLFWVEQPRPAWRHAVILLFDDGLLILAVPLFLVYLLAGQPSPVRWLLVLWTAYYLLIVVVIFHNEIRYRSALAPFAVAGAVGGLAALGDARRQKRRGPWVALAVGLLPMLWTVAPYAVPAWRALRAAWILAPAQSALREGGVEMAESLAFAAARVDRESAWPWVTYGRWLAKAGFPVEALEAQERALMRRPHHWTPTVVLPRLLYDAGREQEAAAALTAADALSWNADPWLMLELAWRELPPPHTDQVALGRGDYGAVRGFLHPLKDHRWSRHRSFVRLIPTKKAEAFLVTVEMGSPAPSPVADPIVTVRARGGPPARFKLSPEVRPYTLEARPQPGEVLEIEIEAPTWNRAGEPAEQGVRVDRVTVAPLR